MENVITFGEKNNFAIQLGLHPNIEKCRLCFFVTGIKMGSFTKGGELQYSLKAYQKFISSKEMYFVPTFEKMTPIQINKYLIDDLFLLGRSSKKEKIEEYEKRKKLHLFWGTQFTNDTTEIILLYKDSEVRFIYRPPKKATARECKVGYDYFCKVFDEYIEYVNKNNLINVE